MLVIEPCILNSDVFPYAQKLGYNLTFAEDGKVGIKRITIRTDSIDALRRTLANLKRERKQLIFIKPLSLDSLRYSIIDKRVNVIVIDGENIKVLKKTMLNLIRFHNKFVEVPLKSSRIVVYRMLMYAYKWIPNVIFSSYAEDYNELWSPISKIDYLNILGADEEEAFKFALLNPIKLLNEYMAIRT
ncbi:RNase P subunit p30 [Sulfolobus sp. A20]|nr:RNase P subunit p30 [Sulfolobus sp. A20]TRM74758.1 RNase P subunit p30 [Sulfolobus sp. A20-N-F8]TRM75789.1 RNase P subunit p30 [Sulfolobus sp. B5]TRM80203.1 RNase P subunit p30 [Sulfolobus sp. D5]TRM97520.1 RNase P subunit p30 [Sulfolobus sp. B1]TRM98676.1 RNase P subunit p30 [Sulfolobus sp. F1]TRN00105.1 RNase P subunit p30 [Sulfolobus sp. E1]